MGQVTTRKVVEGPSHLLLSVTMLSEGSGELDNHVLLSPSDLSPPFVANAPRFRIMQVWYGLVWFDITFAFGGIVPRPVWTFARDTGPHVDFRSFGGLRDYNENPPADYTGEILISTNGFDQLGSQGSLVIELRKT